MSSFGVMPNYMKLRLPRARWCLNLDANSKGLEKVKRDAGNTVEVYNANVFEVLMDAVQVCSLGQITNALFEVGGQYRRNM